jgi:hypothetical protein
MINIVRQWACRAAITIVSAASMSCSPVEEIPVEPLPDIPVPTALSGFLSANGVQLFWEFDTTYVYGGFDIFRSEDEQATWFYVATDSFPPYSDTNLRSQTNYWYRISGLSPSGLRGSPSVSWPARPAVYEVLIDDGALQTGTRDVLLTFTAPFTQPFVTQNVRFSEDSVLTDVQWRDFGPAYPFTLTPGDGQKEVWAQFIDAAGNITQPVSASIELDTFAEIDSLDFVTSEAPSDTIPPGGWVKFNIKTTGLETGGVCEIFVEGMGGTPIPAFDDGNNGDDVAGDGIYQRKFTFALSFRESSMRMSTEFIDAAGNTSVEREFDDNLFMSDPPDSVTLNTITQSTSNSITLNWTRSIDDHFAAYKIYRRNQQPVEVIYSILAGSVGDQATTVFTDTNLPADTTFWYAVFVVNDLDEGAKSNEEQGSTTP